MLINPETVRSITTPSIVIVPLYDVSMSQLRQEPGTIYRSNHIGNNYPTNEAFRNGTPDNSAFLVYDRNTGVDEYYYPWQVRFANSKKEIVGQRISEPTSKNQLSPFMPANSQFTGIAEQLGLDTQLVKTPAQLHLATLRQLHPITTMSDWYLEKQDLVKAVIDVLSRAGIQVFNRQLDETGTAVEYDNHFLPHPGQAMLDTARNLQAATAGEQTAIPGLPVNTNEINVYFTAILEATNPQNQVTIGGERWGYVLHASGPDMVNYTQGYMAELNRYHHLVQAALPGSGIPDKIFFGMIPSAELRFCLPENELPVLEQLVAEVFDFDEKHQSFLSLNDHRPNTREMIEQSYYFARKKLRKLLPHPSLAKIQTGKGPAKHRTHYDAIADGPIRTPRLLEHLTFGQIRQFNKHVDELRTSIHEKVKPTDHQLSRV